MATKYPPEFQQRLVGLRFLNVVNVQEERDADTDAHTGNYQRVDAQRVFCFTGLWLFEVFWVCFLGLYPVFCFLFLSV
jgi:hypothetical protein